MKKGKSITLLSVLGVIMAVLIVLTLVRFPVGIKVYNSFVGAYDCDYDLAGGYAYTLTLSDSNEEEIVNKKDFLKTVSGRIEDLGYELYSVKGFENPDPSITDYSVRIELKKDSKVAADISAIAAYGKVRFFGGTSSSELSEILTDVNAVEKASYLGSTYYEGTTYQNFSVKFTADAKAELDKAMSGASSYYLKAIVGEESGDFSTTVFDTSAGSSPFSITNSYTNGTLSLSYGNDANQVKRMVMLLNKGGIDYKFTVDDGAEITSPYGNATLGLIIALAVVLVGTVVFFCVKGKGFGLIALLTILLILPIYAFMFIAIPGIVVNLGTLVGMLAGAILIADGLFVFYKRLCEEYANGKTVKASVKTAFKRSLMPTLSVGVVSAAVSILVFVLTKGVIKGFAIAFGIAAGAFLIASLLFLRMFVAIVLPLVKTENQDKFLNLKREDE